MHRPHIGDSYFEKKYGFKINVGDVTEENLSEKNREYQTQFLAELEKKLDEENLPDSFFYDLLFFAPSIPVC